MSSQGLRSRELTSSSRFKVFFLTRNFRVRVHSSPGRPWKNQVPLLAALVISMTLCCPLLFAFSLLLGLFGEGNDRALHVFIGAAEDVGFPRVAGFFPFGQRSRGEPRW